MLANGITECRQAVSRKIKSLYKKDVDPERIMIMPGGETYNVLCYSNDW